MTKAFADNETKLLASLLWTLAKLGKIPPAIRDQAKIAKQETGSKEFRMLSDTHTNHEDKLQIKISYTTRWKMLAMIKIMNHHNQERKIRRLKRRKKSYNHSWRDCELSTCNNSNKTKNEETRGIPGSIDAYQHI